MGFVDICVVICNYNKKEYVLKNIDSLKKQTIKSFDIYVVDNASTDGSADAIEERYPEVSVIRNESNLGGSGGFNTGLRRALEKKYKFIILLDNDVIVESNAVKQLYEDMINNPDIGIMGAKILRMDYPETIQEFAPSVNYQTMTFELNHGGEKDNKELPHFVECDYVPACALAVRADVVNQIGCMPEDNFIYYDDIEWGIKCWRAGYKVVANSYATVWHKGGAKINPTTFGTYYLNRNKLHFFMTYMQTKKPETVSGQNIEDRIRDILMDIYEGVYSCKQKGLFNVAKTRMDGFIDALGMRTGKADEYEIRNREDKEEKFDLAVKNSDSIRIYMQGLWENTRRILNQIQIIDNEAGKRTRVELTDEHKYESQSMLGIEIRNEASVSDDEFDLVVHVCSHIYDLNIVAFDRKWVDGWRNIIFDESDFERYRGFNHAFQIFELSFEERVRDVMMKLDGDYSNG